MRSYGCRRRALEYGLSVPPTGYREEFWCHLFQGLASGRLSFPHRSCDRVKRRIPSLPQRKMRSGLVCQGSSRIGVLSYRNPRIHEGHEIMLQAHCVHDLYRHNLLGHVQNDHVLFLYLRQRLCHLPVRDNNFRDRLLHCLENA